MFAQFLFVTNEYCCIMYYEHSQRMLVNTYVSCEITVHHHVIESPAVRMISLFPNWARASCSLFYFPCNHCRKLLLCQLVLHINFRDWWNTFCILLATYIPVMCIRPVMRCRQTPVHTQRIHTHIGQADMRRLVHNKQAGVVSTFWMRSVVNFNIRLICKLFGLIHNLQFMKNIVN
jgi:hypothetical protein